MVTPKSGILEGISHKTVIEICGALDIRCEITDLSKGELLNAQEVFMATTAGGIVPVTQVEERNLGNDAMGPLTTKILQTY